jgi:hypothetical protein
MPNPRPLLRKRLRLKENQLERKHWWPGGQAAVKT